MKHELIIVRYGEIGLKAKATRRFFESKLVNHIKSALNKQKIDHKIKTFRGRIYVYTDQVDKSTKTLLKIFGITSVSPAVKTSSDVDSMIKLAVKISMNNITKNKSFALRVKRTGNHNYTSRDVAIRLGNEIVKKTGASVDLTNPDFKLSIEIREDDAYFFVEKIRGTGGLPYGSQGNVLALINSKNDILASWYMLRRGCNIIYATADKKLQEQVDVFNENWNVDKSKIVIDSKNDINKILNECNCEATVTGHTMKDFSKIEDLKTKINMPILSPLISMDEKDIDKKAKKIGL